MCANLNSILINWIFSLSLSLTLLVSLKTSSPLITVEGEKNRLFLVSLIYSQSLVLRDERATAEDNARSE